MFRLRSLTRSLLTASALLAYAARADEVLSAPFRELAPGVQVAPAAGLGGDAAWGARVVLIDPARARFRVRFDQQSPRLAEWRARFPAALALLNGSFYSLDKRLRPTCDLISAGRTEKGAGCRRTDALFFGASSALGEAPRLMTSADFVPGRWNEALKSFPALVHRGVPGCSGRLYCDEASRTAAIAQLRDGRIALFASQWPAVRRKVARFLAEQLGAVEAVNLDGGPEVTLAVRGEKTEECIATPGVPLPLVLVVEPSPTAPATSAAAVAPDAPQSADAGAHH